MSAPTTAAAVESNHAAPEPASPRGSSTMRLRGLRPASELARDRVHGDRLRYIAGCRCAQCRAANTAYEKDRARARAAGEWNGNVSAQGARSHLKMLSQAGTGRRTVADITGVADTILSLIIAGTRKNIRASTEKKILAVTAQAKADHALVAAGPTWALLDELIADGYTKAFLARQLGYKVPALQLNRQAVTARNAYDVECLHRRLHMCDASPALKLIAELREEGYRQDFIERRVRDLAQRHGLPEPDLTVRHRPARGHARKDKCEPRMRADVADLVAQVHRSLME